MRSPRGSAAVGVSRLGVLLLALGGFFAMHGLAATAGGTQHYSSAAILASAGGHTQPTLGVQPVSQPADGMTDHGLAAQPSPAPAATGAGGPADDGGSHGLMAGCVFVLCALVLLLVARRMRAGWLDRPPPVRITAHRFGGRPERPPPRRIYLSLCLLRV